MKLLLLFLSLSVLKSQAFLSPAVGGVVAGGRGCCCSPRTSSRTTSSGSHYPPHHRYRRRRRLPLHILYSGRGVAPQRGYSWREEAFEIEVTVKVPKQTRAKDIRFKASMNSVELTLLKKTDDDSSEEEEVVLLDPTRPLRGKVSVDGTYWVLEDNDDDEEEEEDDGETRRVTVTIEKLIATPADDFEVVDYDWKGVYRSEEEGEVTERIYDKPEVLNVREYAASMGVDIDNLNMSMVDKTMFTSGLNLTQSSLNQLNKAGLVKEITSQRDGDYAIDDEGNVTKFDTYGRGVGDDEIPRPVKTKLPFVDSSSPWNTAVPVYKDPETNQSFVKQTRNFTRAAFARDAVSVAAASFPSKSKSNNNSLEDEESILSPESSSSSTTATDPIDLLTVKRLKEILKSQGLKVTGTKQELQDRLREQVNSLLQGKQQK